MSTSDLLCSLAVEFNLPPWESQRLTRDQISHLYGRPRDLGGQPRVYGIPGKPAPAPVDYRTQFWGRYRKLGVPEARIAELWEEARRQQADVRRRALERQREIARKRDAQRRKRRGGETG